MAMSDHDPAADGVRALLDLLRESGDGLEATSPDFDAEASAARLRQAAQFQSLVHGEFAPENELAVQGDRLERESPPFDVDAGAVRLGEAARAQGLLGDLTAGDLEPPRVLLTVDFGAISGAVAMTSNVPVVLDRYRRQTILGTGGFGRVWLADDLLLNRRVVLKELTPSGGDGPEKMQHRALAEARALAKIKHSSVSQIYDVFLVDEQPWITMEYIEGETLEQATHNGPLDDYRIAEIGIQILGGLIAAHTAGVLHRDIKPANIILAPDAVHLVDFGIAEIDSDQIEARRSTKVLGTLEYMAPERLLGQQASPASDLWSLGATLYYAMEGQQPFRRGERNATINAILHERPKPRRTGQLSHVVLQLLNKNPYMRPNSTTVAKRLEGIRNRDMTSAKATESRKPIPRHPATVANSSEASEEVGNLLEMPVEEIGRLLARRPARDSGAVLRTISDLRPGALGPILGALPTRTAARMLGRADPRVGGQIIAALPPADVTRLLQEMPAAEAAALLAHVEPSIVAAILTDLAHGPQREIFEQLRAIAPLQISDHGGSGA